MNLVRALHYLTSVENQDLKHIVDIVILHAMPSIAKFSMNSLKNVVFSIVLTV